MEDGLVPKACILALLLFLSAYFSGSESAIFSLSRLERDLLKRRSPPLLRRIIESLLSTPDEILITILTGNMLVNVFASTLAEVIGEEIFPYDSELFSILGMTLLLMLIGEMTPKNIAVRHPSGFIRVAALPLYLVFKAFKPLRWFLNLFNRAMSFFLPLREEEEGEAKRRIILSAVQIGYREGILNQSELNLFQSYYEFRNKSAQEVMIPRSQVKGVEISTELSRLLEVPVAALKTKGSPLIPVYEQDMDHLIGYIDLKDLLPYKYGLRAGKRLRQIVKPFLSIPASKRCAELMLEMRENNTEMALVVDEYGGTDGIITFQGMIEILFSHFFPERKEPIEELGKNSYRIPGRMEVESLNELFGTSISTDFRTVAGLITDELQEIPAVGTRLVIDPLEFRVQKIARNRIITVDVRKLER